MEAADTINKHRLVAFRELPGAAAPGQIVQFEWGWDLARNFAEPENTGLRISKLCLERPQNHIELSLQVV
jgi:hypothetical protein